MPAMKNLATTRRRTGVLPFVAIASATLAACASAPAHRWVSGICDASVALDADIISSIDIKPVQTGGSLINVEINTEDGEHRRGFGCNLLPPTFRNQFKGPDLADNASSDIRKQGYKVVADTTRPVAPLRQAEDAVVVDTTHLDLDGAVDACLAVVEQKKTPLGEAERGF